MDVRTSGYFAKNKEILNKDIDNSKAKQAVLKRLEKEFSFQRNTRLRLDTWYLSQCKRLQELQQTKRVSC